MAQTGSTPVAPVLSASAPRPSSTLAATASAPQVLVAPSLQITNLFDKERKVWPDRVPPPPPPAPPPAPAAVTDQDMQLYGVVIAGSVKRATVKVGKRFAGLAPEGRPFASLQEGQSLGEFTLAQIHPTHIVLQAPGGQQPVYFTKKTDRGGAASAVAAAAPVQGASTTPGESPPPANGQVAAVANADTSLPAGASTHTAGAINTPPAVAPVAASNSATPATPAEINIPNSLAAALAAARANATKGSGSSAFQNPFMQKP